MSSTNRKAEKPSSVLGLIGAGVSYIALCLTVLAALALVIVPMVTGSQTYSVLTSSMAPKYAPGTFLVVKPVPFEELRVGDVITYQIESGKPAVITHRISSISATQTGERQFITKGDNNDIEDERPVTELQVRGKLFYAVPYVGFVANSLGNSDRGTAAQWGAVALMGYGVVSLVSGVLAKKRGKDSQDNSGPESGDNSDPDFPGYGSEDPMDPLEHDDPRLDDCETCEHPRRHRHLIETRKHATV